MGAEQKGKEAIQTHPSPKCMLLPRARPLGGDSPSRPGRAAATPELARSGADSVCLRGHAPLHPPTF